MRQPSQPLVAASQAGGADGEHEEAHVERGPDGLLERPALIARPVDRQEAEHRDARETEARDGGEAAHRPQRNRAGGEAGDHRRPDQDRGGRVAGGIEKAMRERGGDHRRRNQSRTRVLSDR